LSGLNFTLAPVNFERKQLFDDWEDMTLVGKPVLSKYSAKIPVQYDTDYIIRVSPSRNRESQKLDNSVQVQERSPMSQPCLKTKELVLVYICMTALQF
jgi:hypothetical protein